MRKLRVKLAHLLIRVKLVHLLKRVKLVHLLIRVKFNETNNILFKMNKEESLMKEKKEVLLGKIVYLMQEFNDIPTTKK